MKKIVLSLFVLVMAFSLKAQQVNITFQVDMTPWLNVGGTIGQGVHVAGSFADDSSITLPNWTPDAAGSLFTNTSGNIWTNTIPFKKSAAGDSLQFKFLCDSAWNGITPSTVNNGQNSEGQTGFTNFINGEGCTAVGTGNRIIAIPSTDALFTAAWDSCGTLTALTNVINIKTPQVNSLYPNPANGSATLVYTIGTIGKVQIYVTNLVGQVVKTVLNTSQTAGLHSQSIDVSSLANGVYFLTLKVNDQSVARKFNVMN